MSGLSLIALQQNIVKNVEVFDIFFSNVFR